MKNKFINSIKFYNKHNKDNNSKILLIIFLIKNSKMKSSKINNKNKNKTK